MTKNLLGQRQNVESAKTMTFEQIKSVASWNPCLAYAKLRKHPVSPSPSKKVTSIRKSQSNVLNCIQNSSSELHGCHWSTRLFSCQLVFSSSW